MFPMNTNAFYFTIISHKNLKINILNNFMGFKLKQEAATTFHIFLVTVKKPTLSKTLNVYNFLTNHFIRFKRIHMWIFQPTAFYNIQTSFWDHNRFFQIDLLHLLFSLMWSNRRRSLNSSLYVSQIKSNVSTMDVFASIGIVISASAPWNRF